MVTSMIINQKWKKLKLLVSLKNWKTNNFLMKTDYSWSKRKTIKPPNTIKANKNYTAKPVTYQLDGSYM